MNKLPSTQTMYRALLNRDTTFEGIFYVGVKTTGIFCRPGCPAKKPKEQNVEFFPSINEALFGGYRPCERCKPMDRTKPPALVKKLRSVAEKNSGSRLTEQSLREMNIDPSTARRQFKRYYGMTFHAFNRSLRVGQALKQVRNGEAVIGAQLDTGYNSASGFWNAFKTIFGEPPARSVNINCLLAKRIETPLGSMLALANSKGLYLLEFVDRRGLENEIKNLRKKLKCSIIPGNNIHLDKIEEELNDYFAGKSLNFSVPVIMTGSPFEKKVWNLLCEIPAGKTSSYGMIAAKAGIPSGSRAIGRTNGKNCLAIIIPCHRVIRSDGTLCGYGGGIWRKKKLLEHEKYYN